jgi:hypothetical protein
MPSEYLGIASITAPEVSAKRLGAAGLDIGDGAQMRGRHRHAVGRQVLIREAAEDVRNLDHS